MKVGQQQEVTSRELSVREPKIYSSGAVSEENDLS